MLGEVFTYAERRDGETEPRYLKTEEHNQNHVQDSNSAPNIVPFKTIGGFDTEPIFQRSHFYPQIQQQMKVISLRKGDKLYCLSLIVILTSSIHNPTKVKSHQLIFASSFLFPLEQSYYITLYRKVNREIITILLINSHRHG